MILCISNCGNGGSEGIALRVDWQQESFKSELRFVFSFLESSQGTGIVTVT